jgi:hypothetical protein
MGNVCPAELCDVVDEVAMPRAKAHRDRYHMVDWFVDDESSTDEDDDEPGTYRPPPFRQVAPVV